MSGTLGPPPAPGWGSPLIAQSGQGGPALAQPAQGAGLTQDDVQQALGMLYGQLGGGVDWAKATGGPQGLLGHAAAPGAAAGQPGQQPSAGAQTLVNAYQGFQQFHDIDQQVKQARALFDNPNGYWSGGEGSGGNGGGQR